MFGKLLKAVVGVVKVPVAMLEDTTDLLLSGEVEGKTLDSLEDLGEDIENLFDYDE